MGLGVACTFEHGWAPNRTDPSHLPQHDGAEGAIFHVGRLPQSPYQMRDAGLRLRFKLLKQPLRMLARLVVR